jgi:hypothetical protein
MQQLHQALFVQTLPQIVHHQNHYASLISPLRDHKFDAFKFHMCFYHENSSLYKLGETQPP